MPWSCQQQEWQGLSSTLPQPAQPSAAQHSAAQRSAAHLAVEVCGEGLHLVPRPRRRAAEQVKGGPRREQALLLLPVGRAG